MFHVSRPVRVAVVLSLVLSLAGVAVVQADAGGVKVLDATMVGLPQAQVGTTLDGVPAGGLPWTIAHGSAQLFSNGRLHLLVQGLVLASGANAGKNPFPTGEAIVTCGGTVAATSSPVPYSAAGNAMVDQTVQLPSTCLAPAVFFAGRTAAGARWFAATGW